MLIDTNIIIYASQPQDFRRIAGLELLDPILNDR